MADKDEKPVSIVDPLFKEVDSYAKATGKTRASVIRAATNDPKRHLAMESMEEKLLDYAAKIRDYMVRFPPPTI